jgi:hypothetical protein
MLKRILAFALFASFAVQLRAQNWTTVSAANITDLNQQKLAAGQLCFLGTDQNDTPISFMVGGGGQVLKRQFCATVTNGATATLTVPNPATSSPSGISYRVSVKDSSTGQEVLRYTGVTFSGTSFNLDLYTPNLAGASLAPLSGTTVSGNLGVTGNISATGTIAAANLPATIPGTGSCSGQFVSVLNSGASPTCSTTLNTGAASGAALSLPGGAGGAQSYIDGSGGIVGTGGYVEFTNDASTTTGYGAWLTNNAFWNGASWIQPRGAGTSSHGLTVSNHKDFSFNFAAANGTNNAALTWTEWANLNAGGFNLKTGNYLLNGSQISFANLAGTASQSQVPWAAPGTIGSTTPNTGAFTTVTANTITTSKRFKTAGGTTLASSDFTFTAGWGSTASIGSIVGTDGAFQFVMSSAGTGQTVAPTVTLNFHDGTWTNPPVCSVSGMTGNASVPSWGICSGGPAATSVCFQATFTPSAGSAYGASVICSGR